MDRRYRRSGKFAAQSDFQQSPSYLMECVVEGIEATTQSIRLGQFNTCAHKKWTLDYLETGLKLLGFRDAACIVKRDFARSVLIFAENLQGKRKP
jgi:hypothetical protein